MNNISIRQQNYQTKLRGVSGRESLLLNSWKQLIIVEAEKIRTRSATELGLPESASLRDIINARTERTRVLRAKELGLPEDTAWKQIFEKRRELQQQ